ncbi:MAG TPA: 6-phosphogluconolactonase [Vicinamibacteria bacterium]|nr:6-phosphogluconolactonase [Vicinamibacteria bacterium]
MPLETLVDKGPFLSEALASRLESSARHAMATRGRFTIALAGGSVATTFFPRLATLPLDWSATHFFWGDERAVPPEHPDSNYGLARSLWLEPAGVPATSVHRMEAEAADPVRAAAEYEAVLERLAGRPPRLDVALLGVGPDGHVCSLFPGHPLLEERDRRVALVEDSPKPPPRRLTLTLPAVVQSRLVIVAVLGRGKAEVVRAALEDPDSALPVALVARQAAEALFLLDPEAASLLRGR